MIQGHILHVAIISQPTSLGVTDTNVAELSQALAWAKYSLGESAEGSLQNGEDGKERENGALLGKNDNSVLASPPLQAQMGSLSKLAG